MNRSTTTGLGTVLAVLALAPAAVGQDKGPPPRPAPVAAPAAPNQFAFDLYARLRGADGNMFFSPYSLSAGLALAYEGARGETARQMAAVLRLPTDHAGSPPTPPARPKPPEAGKPSGVQFHMANALWGQEGYGFRPEYRKALAERHGAELNDVDFEASPERASQAINAWAEKQTQGKVKQLLRPDQVDPQTRLVLTNAVYLKANWASPFPKDRTREGAFHTGKDRTVTAPFMSRVGTFLYAEEAGLQAVELPYAGGDVVFTVLLPRSAQGLADVEKTLSAGRVADLVHRLRPRKLEVALPKFRLSAEYELKKPLAKLGMALAFDKAKADFSGMCDGEEPLFLAAVVHKAAVDVDEEGTEAAAATGTTVKGRSIPADPVVVRADRPFVFLIHDRNSGRVLFLGRLVNPLP